MFLESKTVQQIPQEQGKAFTISVACGYLPQNAGRSAAAQPAGHTRDAGSQVPVPLTFLCYRRFPPICGGPVIFIQVQSQTGEGRSSWRPNPHVQGHVPWASQHPSPSHVLGAKYPSRALISRNQAAPWAMEQVRLDLPLHHQKSSSARWVGNQWGKRLFTANRTGMRHLYL